jgi:antitoxin YefM
MTTLTVHEAQTNLEQVVLEVVDEAGQAVLTTDNGKQAVLISLDEYKSIQEYRSIQETEFLLSNPKTAKQLYQALEELEQGKVVTVPLDNL